MNREFVGQLVDLAMVFAKNQTGGSVREDVSVADTLWELMETAAETLHEQTGQEVNISLIHAEEPI